jgi:broad specificity phosphatase PhoE
MDVSKCFTNSIELSTKVKLVRKTEFIFVRHGETVWNEQRRFQGQSDVPLSTLGKLQAMALKERLRDEHIDEAYSSDLTRAYETATIILSGRGMSVNKTPSLRERHLGGFEGLTFDEALASYPSELEAWLRNPLSRPPSGEGGEELITRVKRFIDTLLGSCHGKRILIVSHSGPIKVALCVLLRWSIVSLRHFRIANASLSIVELVDGAGVCKVLNDTCHLGAVHAIAIQQCESLDQHI